MVRVILGILSLCTAFVAFVMLDSLPAMTIYINHGLTTMYDIYICCTVCAGLLLLIFPNDYKGRRATVVSLVMSCLVAWICALGAGFIFIPMMVLLIWLFYVPKEKERIFYRDDVGKHS